MSEIATCGRALAANAPLPAALAKVSGAMDAQRDLPMGTHDMAAMTDPATTAAFRTLVDAKRQLLALLQDGVAEDDEMLAMMRDS